MNGSAEPGRTAGEDKSGAERRYQGAKNEQGTRGGHRETARPMLKWLDRCLEHQPGGGGRETGRHFRGGRTEE